jgi:hypothetical protein
VLNANTLIVDQSSKPGSEQFGIQQGIPKLSCLFKFVQATDQFDFYGLAI